MIGWLMRLMRLMRLVRLVWPVRCVVCVSGAVGYPHQGRLVRTNGSSDEVVCWFAITNAN
jgi:hypothetical protein